MSLNSCKILISSCSLFGSGSMAMYIGLAFAPKFAKSTFFASLGPLQDMPAIGCWRLPNYLPLLNSVSYCPLVCPTQLGSHGISPFCLLLPIISLSISYIYSGLPWFDLILVLLCQYPLLQWRNSLLFSLWHNPQLQPKTKIDFSPLCFICFASHSLHHSHASILGLALVKPW